MESEPPPTLFSLRALPLGDRRPQNLSEFILRVNAERGGFRNVTEESLREEMQAETDDIFESHEADTVQEGPENEESGQIGPKEFNEALETVYLQADNAHQNAMLALDFLSLLLTKDNPTHAGMSLSPALRELVGIGVLGTDKLAKPHMTEARLQDHKTVATGWKLADIDKNVDSLLTSASRLQKEMTVEAKYWAEVLAVSNKGWTITRIPNEPQNLGVRYGFSEAASDFRTTSLAPMRRSEDGSVDLDCGAILGESKRLLVTIERNGKVVGRSSLPKPLAPDAPLEDRVLEARNTIIAQELWHEMNREGRLLVTYGVRLEQDALSYSPGRDMRVTFTMQPLGAGGLDEESSRRLPEDYLAESLSVMLHQMLTYAHRTNSQRRLRTNPRIRFQTAKAFPYQILRPVLAYMQHEESVKEATHFISALTTVLHSAGITTAVFKLTEPPISLNEVASNRSPPEALLKSLLPPLECQFEFNITPEASVLLHCRTAMTTFISTGFNIMLPPTAPGQLNHLQALYPPGERSNYEGYLLTDLKYYLQQAVARVLLEQAKKVAQETSASLAPRDANAKIEWIEDIGGTALINVGENHDGEERIEIDVVVRDAAESRPDTIEEKQVAQTQPELCIEALWSAGPSSAVPGQRTLSWTLSEAVQGIKQETTLHDVIRDMVTRAAANPPA